ncbi:hypothetical protein BGT96224_69B [Blumeria graminis f. sp. tritici 96224]|uniref:Bgt-69-2 n=1 Tax=Blumeria graminis f. sp. tritici 96224 TaxID=1268274 RepID=A0A061HH44_BLUGR|nr:hypothetical protein BGT96224_69B [Blumeria graminis f. sp. tritici 96224]
MESNAAKFKQEDLIVDDESKYQSNRVEAIRIQTMQGFFLVEQELLVPKAQG